MKLVPRFQLHRPTSTPGWDFTAAATSSIVFCQSHWQCEQYPRKARQEDTSPLKEMFGVGCTRGMAITTPTSTVSISDVTSAVRITANPRPCLSLGDQLVAAA
jgi:hypothetical protein